MNPNQVPSIPPAAVSLAQTVQRALIAHALNNVGVGTAKLQHPAPVPTDPHLPIDPNQTAAPAVENLAINHHPHDPLDQASDPSSLGPVSEIQNKLGSIIPDESMQTTPSEPLATQIISDEFPTISDTSPETPQNKPLTVEHISDKFPAILENAQTANSTPPKTPEEAAALEHFQRRRVGRPSPIDTLTPDQQDTLFDLIDQFGLTAALKIATDPAPDGFGLKTSRPALHDFRKRYPRIVDGRIDEHNRHFLEQSKNPDGDFQSEFQRNLQIQLLGANLESPQSLQTVSLLANILAKMRSQSFAERRLALAEQRAKTPQPL